MTLRRRLACLVNWHEERTLYAPTNSTTKPYYRPETWCLRCRRKLREGAAVQTKEELLEEIRREANADTFPCELLAGAESAACFFAAGFLGRQDVIHVANAGVKRVVVCDRDEEKLTEMQRRYPEGWRFELGDAYTVAPRLAIAGELFDVVTVDPWSNGIRNAWHELPTWLAITRKHLVLGVTKEWFDGLHAEISTDSVDAYLAREHWNGRRVRGRCTQLVWRSNFIGGVFWAVFEKEA